MGIFYQDNAVLESESIFKLSYRTPVVLKAKKGKRSELREIALREAAASMSAAEISPKERLDYSTTCQDIGSELEPCVPRAVDLGIDGKFDIPITLYNQNKRSCKKCTYFTTPVPLRLRDE